jgi:hypothetical protein
LGLRAYPAPLTTTVALAAKCATMALKPRKAAGRKDRIAKDRWPKGQREPVKC